jgi:hypothetical protein
MHTLKIGRTVYVTLAICRDVLELNLVYLQTSAFLAGPHCNPFRVS